MFNIIIKSKSQIKLDPLDAGLHSYTNNTISYFDKIVFYEYGINSKKRILYHCGKCKYNNTVGKYFVEYELSLIYKDVFYD